MLDWIKNHFNTLHNLQLNTLITDQHGKVLPLDEGFRRYIHSVKSIHQNQNKIIFMGNGGSAGMASHLAIDYSKNGNFPSLTFTDGSALTCLSNDYGYEHVFEKQIEYHARKGDVLIAISSSGKSKNILNAVAAAKAAKCQIITFSGFDANNPLNKQGELNFYIDSKEYGFVEVAHLGLAHAMLDCILEERCRETAHTRQDMLETVE